jgi:hypothetical protein
MKTCCTCKQEKPLFEFNKNKSTKDGFHKQCKSCLKLYREKNSDKILEKVNLYQKENSEKRKEYLKNYRELNKEKLKEKQKQHRENNKEQLKEVDSERRRNYKELNPKSVMLYSAKQRAKKQNVPFDLTPNDFEIPDFCPILGIKLTVEKDVASDSSASLDKIIPQLGYVKGNVMVISKLANTMKNKATKDQLLIFAKWINMTYENT